MDTTTLLLLCLTGAVAGAFGGMLGIGGGLIVIPMLTMLLGMTQAQAQGTSLAMMIPPIGLLAVFNYYKSGQVDLKAAGILAVFFFVGAFFGSKIAVNLPQETLKKVFGVFIFLVSIKLMIGK